MKLRMTFDVLDDYRRAVNLNELGRDSKATRVLMTRHIAKLIDADADNMVIAYHKDPDVRKRKARKLNNLGPDLRMRVQTHDGQ